MQNSRTRFDDDACHERGMLAQLQTRVRTIRSYGDSSAQTMRFYFESANSEFSNTFDRLAGSFRDTFCLLVTTMFAHLRRAISRPELFPIASRPKTSSPRSPCSCSRFVPPNRRKIADRHPAFGQCEDRCNQLVLGQYHVTGCASVCRKSMAANVCRS